MSRQSGLSLGLSALLLGAGVYSAFARMAADQPTRAATQRVALVEQPVARDQLRDVGGFLGGRLEVNDQLWLRRFDIDHFVGMVEKPAYRDWFWVGEQPGKWLEAAILTSEATGDAQLREEARTVLDRLEAAQEADGYLGVTDPAYRTTTRPVRGMDAYEGYFTLHALITSYEQLGDPKALGAAKKFADYWLANFGPGKCEFWGTTVDLNHTLLAGHNGHCGLEGTLLIDPVMRLYEVTGDERYLDWCRWVVGNIDKWSGHDTFSNLDNVVRGTMTIDQVQPYVHAHTFQMNFEGFLRLYQATGDETLLRKVKACWQDVASRQMYVTGGVSVGEHYAPGHVLPNRGSVVETCASMSWIELSQYLLELTGDTKYADAIERLVFNHLAAAQSLETGIFRYHTPLTGMRPAGYQHGPDCCTSSGPRILSELPGLIYASGPGGVYVNQFVASSATVALDGGGEVRVRQVTDFPASGKVRIEISGGAGREFALNVRVPKWCDGATVAVNGASVSGAAAGGYAVIKRQWAEGDMVELTLPMTVRWVKGDYGNTGLWCLMRGPIVYALDSLTFNGVRPIGPGAELDPAELAGVAFDHDSPPVPTEVGGDMLLGPGYEVPIRAASGQRGTAVMVPFGRMGNWLRPGEEAPPEGEQYPYSVWVVGDDASAFARVSNISDSVWVADESSEKQHAVAGDGMRRVLQHGRMVREASGWFSYEMVVPAFGPSGGQTVLRCIYLGRVKPARTFDVLIDGQKIGTQALGADASREMIDAEYEIPAAITTGKSKVVVRFGAEGGSTAGSLVWAMIRTGHAAPELMKDAATKPAAR